MTSLERAHNNRKAGSKRQSPKQAAKNPKASIHQAHPAAIIQRARLDPGSLTPNEVRQLQGTIGNQGVRRLLSGAARRQPAQGRGDKTGLLPDLKAAVERLSGLSMDDVRVHYNSAKPAGLGASAYTQGADIHLGPGQEAHLPHEAWHVVQQKQGRVNPTTQLKQAAINDDADLEREADVMGENALRMTPAEQGALGPAPQGSAPPQTASPPPSTVQRALNPGEADALTTRAGQLSDRLDQIIARLPDVIGNHVTTDDFMDPIRDVTNKARHQAAAVDFAPLNQVLDTAKEAIDGLDQVVARSQADFDAIGRAYNAVPVGDRAAMFADLAPEFARLGKRIAQKKANQKDVGDVRRAVERALIPDNKEIQEIRAQNAQTAMDRVAMLVQAGLAQVGNLQALYASEFDAAADHFGGAWGLKPAAGTGRLQWLREWEFHVHATVQRAGAPPNAVTGFTIHRAHIKPSSGARALGVSIQITNPALLTQVQNDTQRKIVNWAQTREGEAILKKIRRN